MKDKTYNLLKDQPLLHEAYDIIRGYYDASKGNPVTHIAYGGYLRMMRALIALNNQTNTIKNKLATKRSR